MENIKLMLEGIKTDVLNVQVKIHEALQENNKNPSSVEKKIELAEELCDVIRRKLEITKEFCGANTLR